MDDDEYGVPPAADILDKEFEVIRHYMLAINRHYPIISFYLDELVRGPQLWSHGKLSPQRLREFGKEMQTMAGHYLSLGRAVLRWADRRENALNQTPMDSPDRGWEACGRTVPFLPARPNQRN